MRSPRTPAPHSPTTFHSSRPPSPPFPALPLRPRRAGTPSPRQAPRSGRSGGGTTTPGGESGAEGAGASRPLPLHLSRPPGSCRRPPCLGGGHFASWGAGRSGAERRDYSSQGAPQRRHFAACAGQCSGPVPARCGARCRARPPTPESRGAAPALPGAVRDRHGTAAAFRSRCLQKHPHVTAFVLIEKQGLATNTSEVFCLFYFVYFYFFLLRVYS